MWKERKGKDCDNKVDVEKKKKPLYKSKVKYYNCQNLGNFADECELPKEYKSKGRENEESLLLMVIAEKYADVLVQGMSCGYPIDDMWYLDTVASSHMIGMKTLYQSLDESHKRLMRFGDGSSIRYEDKGEKHVDDTNSERMIFENVPYIPKLKNNIFIILHDG